MSRDWVNLVAEAVAKTFVWSGVGILASLVVMVVAGFAFIGYLKVQGVDCRPRTVAEVLAANSPHGSHWDDERDPTGWCRVINDPRWD
jgi:hypothetical protein